MSNTNIIFTEEHNIQTPCKLFVVGDPQVLLIQPSARHEEKNDGVRREVNLIARASSTGFAMVFFDCVEWARALMPWADDAVSRDAEVGRHAPDTLRFIEHTLLPWLRERFGALSCIIGGYSLGGLFALWAARNTDAFAAVAAASPSLWIKGWGEYAAAHPISPGNISTPQHINTSTYHHYNTYSPLPRRPRGALSQPAHEAHRRLRACRTRPTLPATLPHHRHPALARRRTLRCRSRAHSGSIRMVHRADCPATLRHTTSRIDEYRRILIADKIFL